MEHKDNLNRVYLKLWHKGPLPLIDFFRAWLDARYCYRNSDHPSLLVSHAETVQYIEICSAPHDGVMLLVFEAKFCNP